MPWTLMETKLLERESKECALYNKHIHYICPRCNDYYCNLCTALPSCMGFMSVESRDVRKMSLLCKCGKKNIL